MATTLYLQENFTYNNESFVIKAFNNEAEYSYTIKAFFADGRPANNLSYSVSYQNQSDLIVSTGDNAVVLLMNSAKDALRAGHYFLRQ